MPGNKSIPDKVEKLLLKDRQFWLRVRQVKQKGTGRGLAKTKRWPE